MHAPNHADTVVLALARGRAYAVFTTAARKGEYDRIRVVRRMHGRMTDVLKGRIN